MVSVIIPARFASTRLPGKPLIPILGKPMIRWVYENVKKATHVDEVIVATDDKRIYAEVLSFGGQSVMTSEDLKSGTDRVFEASKQSQADIIINVQGDEPLISPILVDEFAQFMKRKEVEIGTIAVRSEMDPDFDDPNCVKVVLDHKGNALYFSRSPIPHGAEFYYKHVGIYGFKKSALKSFVETASSNSILEHIEKLEQLRALESGIPISVLIKEQMTHLSIDTPQDLERVQAILEKRS